MSKLSNVIMFNIDQPSFDHANTDHNAEFRARRNRAIRIRKALFAHQNGVNITIQTSNADSYTGFIMAKDFDCVILNLNAGHYAVIPFESIHLIISETYI